MADNNDNNNNNNNQIKDMVGITRILEYYGPREWVENVIKHSRVPLNGTIRFPGVDNGSIKSGVVMWSQSQPSEPSEQVKVNVDDLAPNIPVDSVMGEPIISERPKLQPFPRPAGSR